MNIPKKGLCIVISELDVADIVKGLKGEVPLFGGGIFQDLYVIADCIRVGKKIQAIKEVRAQTGWGLKEAKEFMDNWYPMGLGSSDMAVLNAMADKFLRHHMPKDFLNDEDMSL